MYEVAQGVSGLDDWEISHNKGQCYLQLRDFEKGETCFRAALDASRHESTFLQLGKLYSLQERYDAALEVYMEALDYSPNSPELLTNAGLMYLRLGDNSRAFEMLGSSLTHDPRDARTILAAGSIIQSHKDVDVA